MPNTKTSGKQRLFINIAPLQNLRIVCPKYAYHGYEDVSVDATSSREPDREDLRRQAISAIQDEPQLLSIIDYIDEQFLLSSFDFLHYSLFGNTILLR